MATQETLLLGRSDIVRTMALSDYIEAVERAFHRLGTEQVTVPEVVHIPAPDGAFHIKSAGFQGEPSYVAVKVNGNFPHNQRRNGLPTIQGAIVLCNGKDGSLLAVIDSIEVTAMRTGAATAVAAKYLAPKDAEVATVIGCGVQGRVQLLSLNEVLSLKKVYVFDMDGQRAEEFARQMVAETGLEVIAVGQFVVATRSSQVIVTCTSSRRPFLRRSHVAPGTFVAAVGADNDDKQELDVELMAGAQVIVDVLEQCAAIGELHHALDAGAMVRGDVFAELAKIVAGQVKAEFKPDDIIVFDSTGSAIQDVAAAALIYERARSGNIGMSLAFA